MTEKIVEQKKLLDEHLAKINLHVKKNDDKSRRKQNLMNSTKGIVGAGTAVNTTGNLVYETSSLMQGVGVYRADLDEASIKHRRERSYPWEPRG